MHLGHIGFQVNPSNGKQLLYLVGQQNLYQRVSMNENLQFPKKKSLKEQGAVARKFLASYFCYRYNKYTIAILHNGLQKSPHIQNTRGTIIVIRCFLSCLKLHIEQTKLNPQRLGQTYRMYLHNTEKKHSKLLSILKALVVTPKHVNT